MREINTEIITKQVEELCIKSNYCLNSDILNALMQGETKEESQIGKDILKNLIKNAEIANDENIAICQDTGMVVVFIDIGQDVKLIGENITDAINEGVRRGYEKGFLRKSIVKDPFQRLNSNDNTPAVIHYDIVPGQKIKITVIPKGFGSENMSKLKMLNPSEGIDGVKNFIVNTVSEAGPNPCPPIVIGVGIGGTMEKASILAKKALLRQVGEKSTLEHIKILEDEVLESVNKLGIGPMGLGGRITAFAVNIEVYPTHIAGLPVAVNLNCHALRHASVEI